MATRRNPKKFVPNKCAYIDCFFKPETEEEYELHFVQVHKQKEDATRKLREKKCHLGCPKTFVYGKPLLTHIRKIHPEYCAEQEANRLPILPPLDFYSKSTNTGNGAGIPEPTEEEDEDTDKISQDDMGHGMDDNNHQDAEFVGQFVQPIEKVQDDELNEENDETNGHQKEEAEAKDDSDVALVGTHALVKKQKEKIKKLKNSRAKQINRMEKAEKKIQKLDEDITYALSILAKLKDKL